MKRAQRRARAEKPVVRTPPSSAAPAPANAPPKNVFVAHVRDELMTPKQLATFLNVHPATVRRMLHEGKLPYVPVGKRVRFLPSEVIARLRGGGK